jgi:hypothetical protein
MTIITRTTTEFVGTDVNTLPRLRPQFPGLTPTYRWVADTITGTDGALIDAWSPEVGTAKFNPETTNSKPALRIESGIRMLRFDGVNDAIVAEQGTASGVTNTSLRSVTFVVRVWDTAAITAGTNRGVASLGGAALNQYSDTMLGAFYLPSGTVAKATGVSPTSQFRVVTLVADETVPTRELTVDGTTVTVPNTNATRFHESIRLGGSGTFHGIDVLEVVTFSKALTLTERATVRDSMKAAYPTLLL